MTHASQTLSTLSGSFLKLMERNREKLEEIVRKTHEEQLRFVNRRLECTGHALESMRDCHGLSGLIAAEQQWMLDMTRDYIEGAERFGGMFREIAERGADELTQGMETATSELQSATREGTRNAREKSDLHAAAE